MFRRSLLRCSIAARRQLTTSATAPGPDGSSVTHKVVTAAFGAAALYCAFELGKVILDFPRPAELLMDKAKENNEIVVLFGGKVSPSLLWEGSANESTGRASLCIPVSGPSGRSGKLYGQAVKDHNGQWALLNCELHVYKRSGDESPSPYPTSTARPGRPMGVGVDPRTEFIFDLLGPKTVLESKDIDINGWKQGRNSAAGR